MRFEPNEDQAAFLSVVEQMTGGREAEWRPVAGWERFDWSADLDTRLEQAGFYDCAREEQLGLVTAAAMVLRLAQLPVVVECAASAMLRLSLAADVPRPLAVVEDGDTGAVRFLPVARSVLRFGGSRVELAVLGPEAIAPVDSLFAYPMGVLPAGLDWQPVDADPVRLRDAWRVAVAAEIAGALKGGLDAVVGHVRHRRQFGRLLGSFQTIQQRLAAAATSIEGASWLTLKAAHTLRPGDAALALGHAQQMATRVVYDLHQFMGAMGLTLEHPLHRWTYRVRLLRSTLGGASRHFADVSSAPWGEG